MAELDERQAARVALERVWQDLDPIVDEATARKEEAARNPSLLSDPRVEAETRWLWLFERELGEVQTVYTSAESGAKLSTEALRSASEAGRKLLDIITQARERVPASTAAA